MTDVTLWHNPRCSKSRAALALLEDAGHTVLVRRYLEDTPSLQDLRDVQVVLGLTALGMARTREAAFKEAGLTRASDDAAVLAAMVAHPILIERPVAITPKGAVIGRPPERVLEVV
ncbi:arsenate reductase (glutaredoxin) [Tropicimonas sp. S265A]|uniref:arsenate reductase (glutaredoxin) n=1 Tax=Tropicimonas sp. S265A TaxID=3415134 RepID=UPI003C7BC90D